MSQDEEPIGGKAGDRAYLIGLDDDADFNTMLEVLRERHFQRNKGYLPASDDLRTTDEMVQIIRDAVGAYYQGTHGDEERMFIRIAAVAIAAASSFRRKTALERGMF